ncbi:MULTISPECIES: hypothetical protein [unclassified Archaeoglobus]|jgi:hypothetical protein|uniref:hypothetical protein n=1 Tax=unclassified Archaeoglobus TaxID=2643606 RepID=UPI0025C5FBB8|nr:MULTISPECIES: hypothetical protein [unclassified Archaeoglobus]
MKHVYVSLPTAVSSAARLYMTCILTNDCPDCVLLARVFFLTLAVHSFDRTDYGKSSLPAVFT